MMKRIDPLKSVARSLGLLVTTISLVSGIMAKDDGERLFKQNCAACHGQAGEGAARGTFPPLAESPWIQGEPERAIQVLLHGLEGPIDVDGKTFNLAMPPQGAMLTDRQIAAILSYVRQNFGNEESSVNVEQVAKARQWSSKREEAWTATTLLRHYPLPKRVSPIQHLLMEVYHGNWKGLPDFEAIEWVAFEEENEGFISLKNIKKKDGFAVVWHGGLEVPADGEYTFELDADDGARVLVGGEVVAQQLKSGPLGRVQKGKVVLKKGTTPLRVEYFELSKREGIRLSWSGPAIKGKQWLSDKPNTRRSVVTPVIDLTPKKREAVMYNNFIAGTTPRALGVGYPEGQNLAFSTQHCSVELVWRGKFMSGGRHWTARGQGAEKPLSSVVAHLSKKPPFQLSERPLEDWEITGSEKVQFKGYLLDAERRPTFSYSVGSVEVVESITTSANGLVRELTLRSEKAQNLAYLLSSETVKLERGELLLGGQLRLKAPGDIVPSAEGFFTNIALEEGVNTLTLIYTWN